MTNVSISTYARIGDIAFAPGATPYVITGYVSLNGNGVLNNSGTAATPISGVFANLADGSTITAGSNTLQVSYEGGDGNDLTLTVVR